MLQQITLAVLPAEWSSSKEGSGHMRRRLRRAVVWLDMYVFRHRWQWYCNRAWDVDDEFYEALLDDSKVRTYVDFEEVMAKLKR